MFISFGIFLLPRILVCLMNLDRMCTLQQEDMSYLMSKRNKMTSLITSENKDEHTHWTWPRFFEHCNLCLLSTSWRCSFFWKWITIFSPCLYFLKDNNMSCSSLEADKQDPVTNWKHGRWSAHRIWALWLKFFISVTFLLLLVVSLLRLRRCVTLFICVFWCCTRRRPFGWCYCLIKSLVNKKIKNNIDAKLIMRKWKEETKVCKTRKAVYSQTPQWLLVFWASYPAFVFCFPHLYFLMMVVLGRSFPNTQVCFNYMI